MHSRNGKVVPHTLLLKDRLCVAAPTGVAAFNVDGYTLHSLLSLPVMGDFKPLEGKRLQNVQEMLASVEYIIIDRQEDVWTGGQATASSLPKPIRGAVRWAILSTHW